MELLDYFRLGLAIGEQLRSGSEALSLLCNLERLSPEAQFVVIGVVVGHYAQGNPWEILEKLEAKDGDENCTA